MKLKKILALSLAFSMLMSIPTGTYVKKANAQKKEVANDYIVMDEDGKVDVMNMTKEEAKDLKNEKSVLVEKDYEIAASSKDKKAGKNKYEWNIKAVHADKNMTNNVEKKIKVAIIDSGVDNYNDIELADSINLIPGEENVDTIYQDVSGHGSSVAGIIAAKDDGEGITGINPNVEVYSAKVMDGENKGSVSRVIEAIKWAMERKVNIINMSFGTINYSSALYEVIKDAKEAGILMIAAAGNGNECEYPAAFPEVMAVGATTTNGEISEASASGDEIEIVAPGEKICSTGAFGGTIISSGTSMSAPHITGIATKLWEKDPSVSANFIRQLLDASANQFTTSDKCGNGQVDYSYAEKIYTKFKKNFNEENTAQINQKNISKNKTELQEFDDVNYVEGRWESPEHDSAISNSSLSNKKIAIVKSGVIYPDIDVSMTDLGKHPYWHGGYKCSNYISSYIYVTKIAIALKNGKKASSVGSPVGLSSADKSSMLKSINAMKWSNLLATPSDANKCLFMCGMAIHDAMDVYAHSSWGNFSGNWRHLDHGTNNGYADKTKDQYFPGRYITARDVAKKCLETYVSGSCGKVSDFLPSNSYSYGGVFWKIKNLYSFANVFDSNIANKLKAYTQF